MPDISYNSPADIALPAIMLHLTHGLGPSKLNKAMQRCQNLQQLLQQDAAFWLNQIRLGQKGWQQIHDWQRFGTASELFQLASKDLEWQAAGTDRHIITRQSNAYPEHLNTIYDPPTVLYVQGQISALARPGIAIVGARNATRYGIDASYRFAQSLCHHHWSVISGLAIGIDGAAHQGAVDCQGITVAVLGSGLNQIYPQRHQYLAEKIIPHGVLVSEFTPDTSPRPGHFPQRNRIIAGLSQGLLLVEAAEKSGSLITASMAIDEGRPVFAIPGSLKNPLSRGCHKLIQEGAQLVLDEKDFLQAVNESSSQKPISFTPPMLNSKQNQSHSINRPKHQESLNLSSIAQTLLFQLTSDPTPLEVLGQLSQIEFNQAQEAILELEVSGVAAAVPGGFIKL